MTAALERRRRDGSLNVGLPARRDFVVGGARGRVPASLWAADIASVNGLILVQHGGSGHRLDNEVAHIVSEVGRSGLAALAIDGPVHGERRVGSADRAATMADFRALWAGTQDVEAYGDDWLAVIAALRREGLAENVGLGWYGPSMGTAYGLSLLARLEFAAAVLGKWSLTEPSSTRLSVDARAMTTPTLFVQHWEDELFDREGTMALFTAIAAPDKRLHAYPGRHAQPTNEEIIASVAFLKGYATVER